MIVDVKPIIERLKRNRIPEHKSYKCEKCKDTGWILSEAENGQDMATMCECYKINRARELMKRSGIPSDFGSKSFDNFETRGNEKLTRAKQAAVGYSEDFFEIEKTRYNSIIFHGQPGAGKTHLGSAICARLMNGGVAVTYMMYRNDITRIKQHLIDSEWYDKELARFSNARVLYIDDFLKGKKNEADLNPVYEIINYRYMNNLPMIISTEKNLDELIEFDEATASRIIEMCRGNIVGLVGRNLNYRLFS